MVEDPAERAALQAASVCESLAGHFVKVFVVTDDDFAKVGDFVVEWIPKIAKAIREATEGGG